MSDTVNGPWFETLVCCNHGKCDFYLRPPILRPERICRECGGKLVVKTARYICKDQIKRSFSGLFKSKDRVVVGFELLENATD